ncbi:MAG: hypothetical protein HOF21_04500 [Nitrospina sp.]|jgi:hypothetical protein|nr:hypothetical protein [Nitrospina sp.]MBT5552117.1 hypothetical protein [Nitrospina sp.]
MNNKPDSHDLLLEILMAEIETVLVSSEKIQSRFRQISNMGILENIAHKTFGATLGDLAKAILNGADIKDSLPKQKQEQSSSENNSISERQELLPQVASGEDSVGKDKPCQNENTCEETKGENHCLNQQVDGKKLSPNEIRFQEYLEKNFNEGKWLVKARIYYPSYCSETE